MDISKFLPIAPGKLVRLTEADTAFVPHPLPPRDWSVTGRLWPKLAEAKQAIGVLEGIGRTLPNADVLLRPLQDREALRSSSLEGTFATPEQLLLLELGKESNDEARSLPTEPSSVHEVANYGAALQAAIRSNLPLSLRLVRTLHKVLLTGVRGEAHTPGRFRRGQVYIGHNKRFIPPPSNELTDTLDAFEKYIHHTDEIDPLVRCYLIHYQFEAIHPFLDGNGRVGRLLLALMLQRWCGLTKPWLYMSAFFDRFKDEYVGRLFNVSARAEWDEWIDFCLEGTTAQANDTVDRCQRLLDLRENYQSRILRTKKSVRLGQLVEDLLATPFTQIPRVKRRFKITYPTAKADVEALVRVGILREVKDMSPRTFVAQEVFDIAFGEPDS